MSPARSGERLGRLRAALPLPCETVAWLALAARGLVVRGNGLNLDMVTVRYTVPPMLRPTAVGLLSGIALYALFQALRRRPVRPYLRTVISAAWWTLGLRIWVVCLVLTYTYMWLKVSVPLINYRLWDEQLWSLDRIVHFGISPSIFWRELLAGSGLLPWIDRWYGLWTSSITLAVGFFCAAPEAATRRRVMLSTVLLWVLGSWIYLALPAVGPAYVRPEVWDGVREEMPASQNAQAALWRNYQRVLEGREGELRAFKPAYGVAALPSLHVAGHFLLLLWIRRWARPLLVPAVLAVTATFVGSVVTGWHYAVDGYLGIALAWGVDRLALYGDRVLDPSSGGDASEVTAEPPARA
ncbi:MAG: phosphatase PAP2 family protein [Deltaproteobacteria bacterium]|jgi:hypothetical protein|nr:phosphatase PAP2 family protein [Deltaproteobacteria bacterium]